jgi:hypothetical protein
MQHKDGDGAAAGEDVISVLPSMMMMKTKALTSWQQGLLAGKEQRRWLINE